MITDYKCTKIQAPKFKNSKRLMVFEHLQKNLICYFLFHVWQKSSASGGVFSLRKNSASK